MLCENALNFIYVTVYNPKKRSEVCRKFPQYALYLLTILPPAGARKNFQPEHQIQLAENSFQQAASGFSTFGKFEKPMIGSRKRGLAAPLPDHPPVRCSNFGAKIFSPYTKYTNSSFIMKKRMYTKE
ncbi:MAG: hypothetical protein ACI4PD_07230 [Butyricicoccus sp.]